MRLHAPGFLHHLFARGNNKGCIFADDEDYQTFLDVLAKTSARFDVHCVSYCLLWNHYHLLLVPHAFSVSRLMQQLNSKYCQRFNRRHARVGHVLQGRFGCKIVEEGNYARTVLRYIALNPVTAGLVAAPQAWRWSSFPSTIAADGAAGFLSLEHVWSAFGTSEPEVGRARLVDFVGAELQDQPGEGLLYGSASMVDYFGPFLQPHRSNPDFVYAQRFAARLPLPILLDGCTDQLSLDLAAHTAFFEHGYTLAELGRALNRDASTVCRWVQRAAARQAAATGGPCPSTAPTRARNKI